MERDAYRFEFAAVQALRSAAGGVATSGRPTPRQQMAEAAQDSHGFLRQPAQPWQPRRLSDGLTFGPGNADPAGFAESACTIRGRVDRNPVVQCIEDMSVIYEDFLETVEEDFSAGQQLPSVQDYLDLTDADQRAACAILRTTHRDRQVGETRQHSCQTISRGALYRILDYALQKYRRRPST